VKGGITHHPLLLVITLSCGVKISAVCSFVSSQGTRVTDGQADRRTDGQTDRRTERQNYDPQDRARIAVSRGKNLPTHVQHILPNGRWDTWPFRWDGLRSFKCITTSSADDNMKASYFSIFQLLQWFISVLLYDCFPLDHRISFFSNFETAISWFTNDDDDDQTLSYHHHQQHQINLRV